MGPEVGEAYTHLGSNTNRITCIQSRISATVEDGIRGGGGVHPPGVLHQQDNMHTVEDILTSRGWDKEVLEAYVVHPKSN
jgi:hypothetical protein